MTNERRTNLMALKESAKRHNERDITNSILDFIETDTPYPSTQGTTVTHKTVVVNN